MTNRYLKLFKKAIKRIRKKVMKSKKYARKLLYNIGIITKKGRLRKAYRDIFKKRK